MKELGSESPMESLFDIRSLEDITGGEPAALQRLLETLMAGTESTFASRPQPARPLVSGRETPTVSLCEEASSVATA